MPTANSDAQRLIAKLQKDIAGGKIKHTSTLENVIEFLQRVSNLNYCSAPLVSGNGVHFYPKVHRDILHGGYGASPEGTKDAKEHVLVMKYKMKDFLQEWELLVIDVYFISNFRYTCLIMVSFFSSRKNGIGLWEPSDIMMSLTIIL